MLTVQLYLRDGEVDVLPSDANMTHCTPSGILDLYSITLVLTNLR